MNKSNNGAVKFHKTKHGSKLEAFLESLKGNIKLNPNYRDKLRLYNKKQANGKQRWVIEDKNGEKVSYISLRTSDEQIANRI